MQIVSSEMSKAVFWKKKKKKKKNEKIFQYVVSWKFYPACWALSKIAKYESLII